MQTVPRSELRIFLSIMERLEVPTTVLCDCLGVVNGMQALLQGHTKKHGEHGDLWWRIEEKIKQLPDPDLRRVEKVAAHLTWKAVCEGKISEVDWRFNDKVDEKAKRAGKLWRPPPTSPQPCRGASVARCWCRG